MQPDPIREIFTRYISSCKVEDYTFMFIHSDRELKPIQHKHCFHRCMPNSFISVNKGMIENEKIAKRRCFRN